VNDFVITALDAARPKGWFDLTVEGKPPFLVDSETIFKNSLRVGGVVTESMLGKIRYESDLAWLKYKGTQILSRRMVSERELRRKLTEEKRPANIREEVITQLKHYGFLDDLKFAASFVRTQIAHGPKSKMFLKQKLREKGIQDEIALQAIEAEFGGIDEVDAVKAIAAKKYNTVKYLPAQKAKSRVINFLRSRGFPWDIIRQAIDDLIPPDQGEQS
jgi:regulatory protein